MNDVDVSSVLPRQIATLHALRASLGDLVETDDQLAAARNKEDIPTVVEEITNLPACMFCFTEAPSAHVCTEKMCIESWRSLCGKSHWVSLSNAYV